MNMNVLVLNCGSSSVKFQIIATDLDMIANNADRRLARGNIERVGGEAIVTLTSEGNKAQVSTATLRDTRAAVELIGPWARSEARITDIQSVADIHAVGHRVVHGGGRFTQTGSIDEKELAGKK